MRTQKIAMRRDEMHMRRESSIKPGHRCVKAAFDRLLLLSDFDGQDK